MVRRIESWPRSRSASTTRCWRTASGACAARRPAAGRHQMVKVYVAVKRKLSVGDKMAAVTATGVSPRCCPKSDMPFSRTARPSRSSQPLGCRRA